MNDILAEEPVKGKMFHVVQIRETDIGRCLRIQQVRKGEPRYITIPCEDIEILREVINRLADYNQQL